MLIKISLQHTNCNEGINYSFLKTCHASFQNVLIALLIYDALKVMGGV